MSILTDQINNFMYKTPEHIYSFQNSENGYSVLEK